MLALALATLLVTACSGGGDDDEAAPASTTPATTPALVVTTAPPPTTTPPTTVKGTPRTSTTLATTIGPGTARIVGTVNGPEGPITGAVIKIERFVGSAVATADVRSQAGNWALDSILGGSYRVTVYRPPDLAQGTAEVFFLGAEETKMVTTNLIRFGDNSVTATVDPNPPVTGLTFILTVRFGTGGVDADGRVVMTPRPGIRVQLNLGQGLGLETAAIVVSDGSGAVAWQVRCLASGQFQAAVLVGNALSALVIPPCTPAAAAPVAPAPPP